MLKNTELSLKEIIVQILNDILFDRREYKRESNKHSSSYLIIKN